MRDAHEAPLRHVAPYAGAWIETFLSGNLPS